MPRLNVSPASARAMRQRSSGMGLDMADMVMRMTPVDRVAAATAQAARLPVAKE